MDDKYIRSLRRMAQDRILTAKAAENLIAAHAKDWEESQHPRGKGGKFVSKGSGGVSSGSGSSESSSSGGTKEAHKPFGSSKSKYGAVKITQGKKDPVSEESPRKKSDLEITNMNELNKSLGEKSTNYNNGSGTYQTIKPSQPSKYPRKADPGAGIAAKVRATRITKLGESSQQHKVASMDSGSRFASKPGEMREGRKFAEGSAFNNPKAGAPTKSLSKGTGATRLSAGDLYDERKPNAKHTINQYLDDNGNLTPEREALHAQSIDNTFAGKQPAAPGEKKVFTMFGGGSASGKGGLSDPKRCQGFKSSFFANGTPSKDTTPTLDADEYKKDIPEYREMMKTDPDNAAAFAHEESSAIAKRGMQAAMDNGYNYTLDGTGDGSVDGVRKKIQQARERGYEVNACYVTCPTELAVHRSIKRGKETGRNVPLDAVRSIHSKVSHIFPQVAADFDHVALFDTSGGKPVLIAECERGQKIRVINQKMYDAFLAKDQEKDD